MRILVVRILVVRILAVSIETLRACIGDKEVSLGLNIDISFDKIPALHKTAKGVCTEL